MIAPLLALLLRRALPGLAVADLALAGGGLYPWVPEALAGLAAPERLPPAERALLRGFRRQGGTRPLLGCDPTEDAALAAGAPEAWGGEGPRLVVAPPEEAGRWLGAAMVLTQGAPPATPRIMLLGGLGADAGQHDLLLAEAALAPVLEALSAAAGALAAEGGGAAAGWETGSRAISPRLGAVTLLAPATALPPLVLEQGALILQQDAGEGRLRVLLGALPARPLRLRAEGGADAWFLDGAAIASEGAGGLREAVILPRGPAPCVLGLGGPGGAPRRLWILPA